MAIVAEAIVEDGVLKLKTPLDLPEGTQVHITIEPVEEPRTALGKRLRYLRGEILASGASTLGWDEISEEVASRRGGATAIAAGGFQP